MIALAVLAALGAGYWYAWRPLPVLGGEEEAPVSQTVTVERDTLGMVRIAGETLEDVFFAQGYATAQDRMWQMETFRRLAAGELAEFAGPAALESDKEHRKLRFSRIAERNAKKIDGEDRAVMAAYARGVNHYLETHAGRLPLEFTLTGVRPRPWRLEDTLLVGEMMFHALSNTYRHDLARTAMYAKGDREKVKTLWPARTGSEEQPGSNAWAVGGSYTATRRTALANDMHLQWSLPGVWHMVHLRGAGLNVAGVTVPGIPGVVVGRNEEIAWGITNLGFDVQDLYFEKIDLRSGRYRDGEREAQAALEREWIAVKGRAPEAFEQWVTRRGPVFAGPEGRPVSLRWTLAEDRPFRFAILDLNRAKNWDGFRAALQGFPAASSNVAYADARGNIGLQVAGTLPVRKGCDGQTVMEAGECEWEGFIPFEELPAYFNPQPARIVTANQNPFPEDYKYTVSGNFAPHYRSRQIRQRLNSRKGWTPEQMVQLQADVYSPFSHFLARELTAAWDRKKATNPALADAIGLLRNWDGQMRAEQAAPLIVNYATHYLRRSVAEKASGMANAEWEPYIYFAVLESLVRGKPAGWYADWDRELLRCLQEGVEEGQRHQGTDVKKWQYGEWNKLTLANPVVAQLPWVGRYFQVGPVGIHGSSTTVKQTNLRLGPSMRMVVDFGDMRGGLLNLPVGQSGHVMSRHARDQWEAYQSGLSFALHFAGGWETEGKLLLKPEGK
jgi:penicillin G amidase